MADLEKQIEQAAQQPESVSGDEGSMTQRPLKDLIEADKYLASKRAATRSRRALPGIRIGRIVQPGAHGNG